ncbi:MAG: S8 family serine peptidase [Synergistaceae bacterium]|nr:S8 family serine peptidase [Synergistaceae bacterium]
MKAKKTCWGLLALMALAVMVLAAGAWARTGGGGYLGDSPVQVAGARNRNYVEGEAMVVLRARGATAFPLSAGLLTRTQAQSAAARVAAETITDRVASEVGGISGVETHAALSSSGVGVFALLKSNAKTTEQLLADLKKHPDVVCASPNYIVRVMATIPNDPRYSELWGMTLIKAPDAWDVTSGDSAIYAAVIDSGIKKDHQDLPGGSNPGAIIGANLIENEKGADYFGDDNGHGTHVSGTIGAAGNNSVGVTGVNWKVSLIALRNFDASGSGSMSRIIKGFEYLTARLNEGKKIPAVNLSLGGYATVSPEDIASDPLYLAFKQFDSLNKTVIVVAAGNEGVEVGKPTPAPMLIGGTLVPAGSYVYPASFIGLNNMIVVGSVSTTVQKSGFSNYSNAYVHLVAPGESILSTLYDSSSSYGEKRGTSMATPHVTGALVLLASKLGNENLTASQLKSHLLQKADHSQNPANMSKYGLLNIGGAVTSPPSDVAATGVAVRPAGRVEAPLGQTKTFAAVVTPEEAADKGVSWTSSNPSAATVDSNGTVTTKAYGETVVTVALQTNASIKAEVNVVVVAVAQPGNGDSPNDNCGNNVGFGMFALLLAGGVLAREKRRKR